MISLKILYPFKICQHTNLHGPALTGAKFLSSSEVQSLAILEWLSCGVKNYHVEVTFNSVTSLPHFTKIY
jgi:hypothetical protein